VCFGILEGSEAQGSGAANFSLASHLFCLRKDNSGLRKRHLYVGTVLVGD